MPQIKNAYARYKLINRELTRNKYVKTSRIVDLCNNEFGYSISSKMIQNDIAAMCDDPILDYNAPIKYCNSRKAHYYTDPDYTIANFGLKEEEINTLQLFAGKLNIYKDYDVFKDFSSALDKVIQAVQIKKELNNKPQRNIIQAQNTPKCKGVHHIPQLITALQECHTISFDYQKFGDEVPVKRKLNPYLLKEDNNRWYIIGKTENKNHFSTFALDRIHALIVNDNFFTPQEYNFEHYFDHAMGITVNNTPPIKITLSFTPEQGNYMKSLPLHHTQEIVLDNQNELLISVLVHPTYELYSKILSYGSAVKVVSPQTVVDEIKTKIKEQFENYS